MPEALLSKAVAWAEQQAGLIAANGIALACEQPRWARQAGVQDIARIRIVKVDGSLPLPDDPELRKAAISFGLIVPGTIGLTFGHGIYILRSHGTRRVLTHEFRHVYQYEQAGSISAFLGRYLAQIVSHGYHDAPFEIDARSLEGHE